MRVRVPRESPPFPRKERASEPEGLGQALLDRKCVKRILKKMLARAKPKRLSERLRSPGKLRFPKKRKKALKCEALKLK